MIERMLPYTVLPMTCLLLVTTGMSQDADQAGTVVERDGRSFTVRKDGLPPSTKDGFRALLPAEGLSGWVVTGGGATVERNGDVLHGHGNSRRNTFLMSPGSHGDFVLEGEVMIEVGGNSGWQVRSRQDVPGDRGSGIRGYQFEVDSSPRSWSGGLYDELRRGWIHPLEGDDDARSAFRNGTWNHYRIECLGPHLRSWVNGVPCADVLDLADLEGHIAFQVHSGGCDVRWRGLRLIELGTSDFVPVGPWRGIGAPGGFVLEPDGSLRSNTGPGTTPVRAELTGRETTFRMSYELEGSMTIRLSDATGERPVLIRVEEGPKGPSTTLSGRAGETIDHPVIAPGAGTGTEREDGTRELVIDLEGPRLVVLIDGTIRNRVMLDGPVRPTGLEIEAGPDAKGVVRISDPRVLRRLEPVLRN